MDDRHMITLLVGGTLFFVLFACALFAYLWVHKRKQNIYHSEKQNLLHSLLDERERTMNEISLEIHDNLAQLLSFAQMNLNAASEVIREPEGLQLIGNADKLLTEISDDLQNIGHSLSSEYIKKHGIIDVLTKEVDYISTAKKINCHMDVEGNPYRLDSEKELLVYRIAQEAIHNAVKHSQATDLFIAFSYAPHRLIMCISDNGVGFDKEKNEDHSGIGIANMKQRAELLHATLTIASNYSGGVAITLTCPTINLC